MANEAQIHKYFDEHRIHQLMQSLTAALCVHQPEDPKAFLIAELAKKNPGNLITKIDVQNAFDLFDIESQGVISTSDALKGLEMLRLAPSETLKLEGEEIARLKFVELVEKALELA